MNNNDDDEQTTPLMAKLIRIMNGYETMNPVDDNTIEFHMEDGSVISMTLKTEVLSAGKTVH